MPDSTFNESGVVLPSLFGTPGEAIQHGIQLQQREKERKQQLDIQRQNKEELDQWKKLNLIQELTDLSKFQTGETVSDALGNKQAAEIFQKYTTASPTMSPTELQANIQKDMSGIISGMNAAKTELEFADKQLAAMKQAYPNVDISKLARDYRADIINRRVNQEGNSFVNPLEVGNSALQLDSPDFLSKYINTNKNLDEYIISPKGLEAMEVISGSPNSYTKYKGKVPFWMKENFNRDEFQNGFYKGKEEPKLQIRSSVLPASSLPSSNGKPFEVIDEDVYNRFAEDPKINLELTASTRNKFPSYDSFTQEEKELAKRNVLFDKIKTLDKSGYYPTEVKTPPVYRINTGTSSKKEAKPFNLSNYKKEGSYYNITVPMQGYTVTAIGDKKLLAKKVLFDPERQMVKLTEYSGRDDQGNPTGESVSEITLDDFLQNIQGNNPQTDIRFLEGLKNPITGKSIQPSGKNYTYNGKPISEEGIRKKAVNSNMTFDEYIKKAGIKVNDK